MTIELTLTENPETVKKIREAARQAGKLLHELDETSIRAVLTESQHETVDVVLRRAQDHVIRTADIYSPLSELYSQLSKAQRLLDDTDLPPKHREVLDQAFNKIFDLYDLINDARNYLATTDTIQCQGTAPIVLACYELD